MLIPLTVIMTGGGIVGLVLVTAVVGSVPSVGFCSGGASAGWSSSLKSDNDPPNKSVRTCRVFFSRVSCGRLVGRAALWFFRSGGGDGVSINAWSFRAFVVVERWISVPTFGTRRLVLIPARVGTSLGGDLPLAALYGTIGPSG